MTPADNTVRWDSRDRRGHVESHFLRPVSPDGARALWIKHTLLSPAGRAGHGVAEAWAIAFERGRPPIGSKSTVPIDRARFSEEPFRVETGDAVLEAGRARGTAESGGHRIDWELSFDPTGPAFHPYPLARMYDAPFPKSKTLTPYPDVRFDGAFVVDGERWHVVGWPGMQGHNWGRSHAHAYAWAQCNSWTDGTGGRAWFEGLSGRVAVGPVITPWLSVAALHVEGETHRFDGPLSMASRRVAVDWYRWEARLRKRGAELRVAVDADRDDLAGLHYENPDGSMTFCLNSKLAHGTIVLSRASRPDLVLTSDRFALELGTKDREHGVPMLV